LVDAGGIHLPKGYTYFAMVFAVVVEMLNIKLGRGGVAVQLHEPDMPAELLEPESE
jgi:predicted tellurium resistance membrane protein TerC